MFARVDGGGCDESPSLLCDLVSIVVAVAAAAIILVPALTVILLGCETRYRVGGGWE